MAATDLIGFGAKSPPAFEDWSRRNNMDENAPSSRRSALHTDCFAGRRFPSWQTRTSPQRRFRPSEPRQTHREDAIRLEERCKERARIMREVHDTLLQGF